ncbi:transmembrane channel-like protein 3 [Plodia interpunctella]|uniref:transmembrane channel-like protein 3 n=1 Tax=Plodia interpunctella TaxID=58824 RepID=UPI0023685B67|nr:transmembrane channel-like protein 3 [Plodia interpunctella]
MEDIEVETEEKAPSMRRTVTLRSNAARQVAVNFMPSRQLPYNTLRLRRSNSEHNALLEESSEPHTQQADIIVREMEQHQRLMEDNPVSEELRREALRDLPQGLTMKRHVRAKLSASVSLRSKRRPISMWKRMKYRLSFGFKKAHERMRTLVFSVELWYEAIRNIEGHFGSAVGSYFYFLRYLFLLNLVFCVAVVSFVVIPQSMHDRAENVTMGPVTFLDFISGKGSFGDSLLMYGHYHHGAVAAGPLPYNMPFAYFFTMLCLYLIFFAVLCIRTAYSYRRNFISTSDGVSHVFANKVFCGWDFGIVCDSAAALSATSIYYEFKELLNEQNKKQVSSSFWIRVAQTSANVIVTAIVLAGIGGLLHRIWLLLTLEKDRHWEIYTSLLVTSVVTVCPLLLTLVVRLEFYRPRTATYVTLARNWLLDIGVVTVLFFYWAKSGHTCWETSFGQESYRLVLLDALFSLFVLPAVEFLRALLYKLYPKTGAPEFNIAYNSLTLLYNQCVVWFGALFSPLLVAAVAAKLLVLFYVKRGTLRACQPARKVWRAAQTQTVLYMLVTLSLFSTLFVIGSVFLGMPSQHCGPFRSYSYVYAVLSEGVLRLSHHSTANSVLSFLTRPGVIAFLMLFLCVAVYYMRARAKAQRSMVAILRNMLVLQAKDKDFLLAAIAKVSNGEWLYSPKPEDGECPDSHTFKYLREVRKPSNSAFHFDASRLSHDRPRSYVHDRPMSSYDKGKTQEDGDTDSSFSWQGSSNYLNQKGEESGEKKWI